MLGSLNVFVLGVLTNDELLKYLDKFKDVLSLAKFYVDGLRYVMWLIVTGLAKALDGIVGGQRKVLKLLNFYESEPVRNFVKPFEPVIASLATIAMIYVFISVMTDKETDFSKIVKNILQAVVLFVGLPFFMSLMSQVAQQTANQITLKNDSSLTSFQYNMTDLYTLDGNDWEFKKDGKTNDIKAQNDLDYLDINEVVDTGGVFFDTSPLSDNGKEILSKQIKKVGNEKKIANLKSHWVASDEAYYRYSWHPFYILAELLCKALVAYFLIYKLIRMIYELGFFTTVFHFSALTDLKKGERNVKMFTQLVNTFIVVVLVFVNQAMYDLMWTYVRQQNFSDILNLGIMIPLTIATIDGPNFIEQFFGMDAGLSSATKGLIALTQGASALKNVASGLKNTVKSGAKAIAKGSKMATMGAGMVGAGTKGALDGFIGKNNPETGGSSSSGQGPMGTNPDGSAPSDGKGLNEPLKGGESPGTKQGDSANSPIVNMGQTPERPSLSPSNLAQGNGTQGTVSPGTSGTGKKTPGGGKQATSLGGNSKRPQRGEASPSSDRQAKNLQKITPPIAKTEQKKGAQNALQGYQQRPQKEQLQGQAKEALTGFSPSNKRDFPTVDASSFPIPVQEAIASTQQSLNEALQPRLRDTDTVGGKVMDSYIGARQRASKTPLATRMRQSYDVSHNTVSSLKTPVPKSTKSKGRDTK